MVMANSSPSSGMGSDGSPLSGMFALESGNTPIEARLVRRDPPIPLSNQHNNDVAGRDLCETGVQRWAAARGEILHHFRPQPDPFHGVLSPLRYSLRSSLVDELKTEHCLAIAGDCILG